MSEDQSGEIENTPSHDANAESSTATEAEVKPEGQTEGETEVSATEKPKEKSNRFQQRINQLTTKNHEERQRNADLESRLKDLESKQVAPKEPDLVAPKEGSFDEYSDYEAANAKFIADNAANTAYERLSTENKRVAEKSQQEKRKVELETKQATFTKNLESKRENFADFEDVAYGHAFMDVDLAEQIFDMDKGPEVAYHLGAHLDEAERIFSLNPVQRARELTKLEYSVEALKPKKISDAPDPITPLGSSETVQQDPDKMTADEWRVWRNKQVHG